MPVTLHFKQLGSSGPKLVILHGLYGNSDNWISIARSLADSFCIYLVDQRNHGHSPHAPVHTYTAMAEDLNAFFQENLIEKAHVLGHSMGGKTAMYFALLHPEKIDKLIIVDIAPKSYASFSNFGEVTNNHRHILDNLLLLRPDQYSSRMQIDQALTAAMPEPELRNFLLKNIYRDPNGAFQWRINLDILSAQLEEIMDGFSNLSQINPFLGESVFIRGEKSPYVKDDDLFVVRKWFKAAQLITIPAAGHWLHAEQPTLFLKTITYFLAD